MQEALNWHRHTPGPLLTLAFLRRLLTVPATTLGGLTLIQLACTAAAQRSPDRAAALSAEQAEQAETEQRRERWQALGDRETVLAVLGALPPGVGAWVLLSREAMAAVAAVARAAVLLSCWSDATVAHLTQLPMRLLPDVPASVLLFGIVACGGGFAMGRMIVDTFTQKQFIQVGLRGAPRPDHKAALSCCCALGACALCACAPDGLLSP